MNYIANFLAQYYEPIDPYDFYREIFPAGSLDEDGAFTPGKFVGVAQEITKQKKADGKTLVKRYTITDELDTIDYLTHSNNFCITSPISYVGKSRASINARIMYALVVEIDYLKTTPMGNLFLPFEQSGMLQLMRDFDDEVRRVPRPTFIVASGTGVHLYYQFNKPLYLYQNVISSLSTYKKRLTKLLWSKEITNAWKDEEIQYESLFQGFRMAGTITKLGDRVEAFRTGSPVSIEYLNSFGWANEIPIAEHYKSKSNHSLKEAEELFPEWYEKVVVNGDKEKKKWNIAEKVHGDDPYALYHWWKRKLLNGAVDGNRFNCLWVLVIYAIKNGVPRDIIEQDCFELMAELDKRTVNENNHFTEYDVTSALQSFEDQGLFTYPINSIIHKTGIKIEKNKRNYRSQKKHMKIMSAIRDIEYSEGSWRNKNGRPKGSGTKQEIVKTWQRNHPGESKATCHRDTNIDPKTIRKWWVD